MLDLVLATVSFSVLVALGAAFLAALTALPWLVALRMAERRGFSTGRWGTASLVVSASVLLGAYGLARLLPTGVAVAALGACWTVPGALWLLEAGQGRLGGRPGAHQG